MTGQLRQPILERLKHSLAAHSDSFKSMLSHYALYCDLRFAASICARDLKKKDHEVIT